VASASISNDGLVTCFAGCPRSEVLAALDALGFTDDYDGPITRQEDYEKRIRVAQAQWAFAVEHLSRRIDAEYVEEYLRSRGITLPVPAVLRRVPLSWVIR
jgi:hypothetical protein